MPTRGDTFAAGGSPWNSGAPLTPAYTRPPRTGWPLTFSAQGAARIERAIERHREAVVLFTQAVFVLDAQAVVQVNFGLARAVVLQIQAPSNA